MFNFIQGWLCNINVPSLNQLGHLSVKKCEQQSPYVTSVNVSIGHDDDAVITQLVGFIFLNTNSSTENGDQGHHLLAAEHLVETGFFYI